MKRIIFSDIDGTLVNSCREITPATLRAIRALQSEGIDFVVVSGRYPQAIFPLLDMYHIQCPIIACGGAYALNENRELIYAHCLNKAQAQEVIEFAQHIPIEHAYNIFTHNQWIANTRDNDLVKDEESLAHHQAQLGGVADMLDDKIGKVMFMVQQPWMKEFEELMSQHFTQLSIVKSQACLLEVMQKDNNKARTIKHYCRLRGVDTRDCIAFGDNYNDVEMLNEVGTYFLMDNAPQDLKHRFSSHTADNNHDGIVVALKSLGLIRA